MIYIDYSYLDLNLLYRMLFRVIKKQVILIKQSHLNQALVWFEAERSSFITTIKSNWVLAEQQLIKNRKVLSRIRISDLCL